MRRQPSPGVDKKVRWYPQVNVILIPCKEEYQQIPGLAERMWYGRNSYERFKHDACLEMRDCMSRYTVSPFIAREIMYGIDGVFMNADSEWKVGAPTRNAIQVLVEHHVPRAYPSHEQRASAGQQSVSLISQTEDDETALGSTDGFNSRPCGGYTGIYGQVRSVPTPMRHKDGGSLARRRRAGSINDTPGNGSTDNDSNSNSNSSSDDAACSTDDMIGSSNDKGQQRGGGNYNPQVDNNNPQQQQAFLFPVPQMVSTDSSRDLSSPAPRGDDHAKCIGDSDSVPAPTRACARTSGFNSSHDSDVDTDVENDEMYGRERERDDNDNNSDSDSGNSDNDSRGDSDSSDEISKKLWKVFGDRDSDNNADDQDDDDNDDADDDESDFLSSGCTSVAASSICNSAEDMMMTSLFEEDFRQARPDAEDYGEDSCPVSDQVSGLASSVTLSSEKPVGLGSERSPRVGASSVRSGTPGTQALPYFAFPKVVPAFPMHPSLSLSASTSAASSYGDSAEDEEDVWVECKSPPRVSSSAVCGSSRSAFVGYDSQERELGSQLARHQREQDLHRVRRPQQPQ
jgi:hypothetical protein